MVSQVQMWLTVQFQTEWYIQRLCRIDPKNRLTALDRCNTYNKGTTLWRPESPPITITWHLSKYGVGKLYQSHTFNVTSVKFIYLVFIHSHARSVLSIGVYFAVSFVICATSDLLDAVNRWVFFFWIIFILQNSDCSSQLNCRSANSYVMERLPVLHYEPNANRCRNRLLDYSRRPTLVRLPRFCSRPVTFINTAITFYPLDSMTNVHPRHGFGFGLIRMTVVKIKIKMLAQ